MYWWKTQEQFWGAQARLCGLRGDVYRLAASNCEAGPLGKGPLQGLALYCRMQARSCDAQGQFCRMLARLLG